MRAFFAVGGGSPPSGGLYIPATDLIKRRFNSNISYGNLQERWKRRESAPPSPQPRPKCLLISPPLNNTADSLRVKKTKKKMARYFHLEILWILRENNKIVEVGGMVGAANFILKSSNTTAPVIEDLSIFPV